MITTKRVMDKIVELCKICMDINNNTEYAAFFEISGHCSIMRVSIRESKEKYENVMYGESASGRYFYYEVADDYQNEEDALTTLEEIKTDLLPFLIQEVVS